MVQDLRDPKENKDLRELVVLWVVPETRARQDPRDQLVTQGQPGVRDPRVSTEKTAIPEIEEQMDSR